MKRGDKVVYVGLNGVRENPHAFYPEIGTVGVVVEVGKPDILVKWDDGSTSNDDRWWCYIDSTKPYTPSDIDTTELDAFMNEMSGVLEPDQIQNGDKLPPIPEIKPIFSPSC